MTDESQLSRELSRRAEDVSGPTLTLEDVRGRARRIRRGRATGVVAVVAVVAAIVVPVSLLSRATGTGQPEPAPSPPTHAVDPLGHGLPTLQGGVIVYPDDGPRIALQLDKDMTPDGFAVLGTDRHVVTGQLSNGGRAAVVVDDHGAAIIAFPLSGGLAAAAGSGAVAWLEPDGTPMLLTADADDPRALTAVEGANPTAVALTGDCTEICTVTVKTSGGQGLGPSWQVDSLGHVTRAPVPAVVDVSPAGGPIAGLYGYAPDDIHVCGGVYDVGIGGFVWRNCDDNVYDFSPDGGLVATTFSEGLGPNRVDLRDAHSGTKVAGFANHGWVSSFAWDTTDHLLVVAVAEDGATSLERIGTEGAETVMDGFTTNMDDLTPGLILPTVG